jgi:hypothetical protein
MSYENVPWCLETATISGASPGEACVLSATNYFLLQGEQRSLPLVLPLAGIDRGLRTGGHIGDNPADLSAQQVVRGGWISDE